ncbi:hypothetical protein EES45_02175 [Streptomyces sp. ADI97-07]|nr:hypothetical protein EES45_02175 [Streptomyces sp. ADI97-07]
MQGVSTARTGPLPASAAVGSKTAYPVMPVARSVTMCARVSARSTVYGARAPSDIASVKSSIASAVAPTSMAYAYEASRGAVPWRSHAVAKSPRVSASVPWWRESWVERVSARR